MTTSYWEHRANQRQGIIIVQPKLHRGPRSCQVTVGETALHHYDAATGDRNGLHSSTCTFGRGLLGNRVPLNLFPTSSACLPPCFPTSPPEMHVKPPGTFRQRSPARQTNTILSRYYYERSGALIPLKPTGSDVPSPQPLRPPRRKLGWARICELPFGCKNMQKSGPLYLHV